jgi:hypothetical protein
MKPRLRAPKKERALMAGDESVDAMFERCEEGNRNE